MLCHINADAASTAACSCFCFYSCCCWLLFELLNFEVALSDNCAVAYLVATCCCFHHWLIVFPDFVLPLLVFCCIISCCFFAYTDDTATLVTSHHWLIAVLNVESFKELWDCHSLLCYCQCWCCLYGSFQFCFCQVDCCFDFSPVDVLIYYGHYHCWQGRNRCCIAMLDLLLFFCHYYQFSISLLFSLCSIHCCWCQPHCCFYPFDAYFGI